MSQKLIDELRKNACPAGKPWTGNNPKADHGHTNCLLFHQAADAIEELMTAVESARSERDLWEREARRG